MTPDSFEPNASSVTQLDDTREMTSPPRSLAGCPCQTRRCPG